MLREGCYMRKQLFIPYVSKSSQDCGRSDDVQRGILFVFRASGNMTPTTMRVLVHLAIVSASLLCCLGERVT